jgi:predicted enzyme related to lactoylglutathione lyase/GNAT superfamily N-acetyltransferase
MQFADICFITDNVLRLVAFYEQFLGVPAAERNDIHSFIPGPGLGVAIYNKQQASAEDPAMNYTSPGNDCAWIGFHCEDAEVEYQRVNALGIAALIPPEVMPWGAKRFTLRDPEGRCIVVRSWPQQTAPDEFAYREPTATELRWLWDKNIADNVGDDRWKRWKEGTIALNEQEKAKTFAVFHQGEPIGEGTLLFSPECGTVGGRTALADGHTVANVNALRIQKPFEGHGHISKLVKVMEHFAGQMGYTALTIGVEARETRNLAIYLHWGYRTLVTSAAEDGALVLYYQKTLVESHPAA